MYIIRLIFIALFIIVLLFLIVIFIFPNSFKNIFTDGKKEGDIKINKVGESDNSSTETNQTDEFSDYEEIEK